MKTLDFVVQSSAPTCVDDVEAQRGLTSEMGPHRIELRASGYETVTVPVQIAPFEMVTYRAALGST